MFDRSVGLALCALALGCHAQAFDRAGTFRRLHPEATAAAAGARVGSALGPWYGFRNGFQNQGRSPVAVRPLFGAGAGRTPWAHPTAGLIWGTPVIDAAGRIFVGSADKVFYALDGNGQKLWSFQIPDAGDALIDSAATLTPDGLVVVPGGDGHLYALDRESGALRWTFAAHHAGDHDGGVTVNSFEGNVTLGPDGNLYAGSDNGWLYSLDPQGNERWAFRTGMMIWSAPAFDPRGEWLVFGSLDGHVYVVGLAEGKEIARFKGAGEFKSSPAVDAAGRIYVGGSDFTFRCLELGPGTFYGRKLRQVWSHATRGEIYSSPALGEGFVVFGSHDGYLHALATASGQPVWKYGVHSRISGSPLLSADGVLFVGAKNGKLYAIDAASGTRIWSFKAAPGYRKVNLDSSPALDPTGRIVLGGYDGKIHGIPVEFAFRNPGDPRVSLDPGPDTPDLGSGVPVTGGTLRYVDEAGALAPAPAAPLGAQAALTLKLVARAGGEYVPNAAIAVHGLTVGTDPPVPCRATIASDGYSVTITPTGFWTPGTRQRVRVKGRYYHRSNPFVDLLKWWNLPAFEAAVEFDVRPDPATIPDPGPGKALRYAVRGLYATEPEALDTLIPAAMEGQGFIASVPFLDRTKGRAGLVVLPGFPRPDGVVIRPSPDKAFALDGIVSGSSVAAEGRMKMAAMGATIGFSPFRMRGRMLEDGLDEGRFHATAPALAIKGNGKTYTSVAWSLLDDMVDAGLNLQAHGLLSGTRLPPLAVPLVVDAVAWKGRGELAVTWHGPVEGEHLLTAAFWDPVAGKVAAQATSVVTGAGGTTLLGGLDQRKHAGLERALLFDGERVPGAP